MRVISLVPSWTETLIEAGIQVVGRTRYCVHPKGRVEKISIVGGTKDINWEAVAACKPDMLIFDREENNKEMAEECPFPWVATHVTGIESMPGALRMLSQTLESPALEAMALRYERVLVQKPKPLDFHSWAGVLEWWRPLDFAPEHVEYLIWKDPWMVVTRQTYIGSVMTWMGWGHLLREGESKYPKINGADGFKANTLFLFSSEPFPFARFREHAVQLGGASALVDGELISWFGLRNLCFLEKMTGIMV